MYIYAGNLNETGIDSDKRFLLKHNKKLNYYKDIIIIVAMILKTKILQIANVRRRLGMLFLIQVRVAFL